MKNPRYNVGDEVYFIFLNSCLWKGEEEKRCAACKQRVPHVLWYGAFILGGPRKIDEVLVSNIQTDVSFSYRFAEKAGYNHFRGLTMNETELFDNKKLLMQVIKERQKKLDAELQVKKELCVDFKQN